MNAGASTHRAVTGPDLVAAQGRRRTTASPGDRIVRQITALDARDSARRTRETVLAAADASRLAADAPDALSGADR
jgi:hypothetical protein